MGGVFTQNRSFQYFGCRMLSQKSWLFVCFKSCVLILICPSCCFGAFLFNVLLLNTLCVNTLHVSKVIKIPTILTVVNTGNEHLQLVHKLSWYKCSAKRTFTNNNNNNRLLFPGYQARYAFVVGNLGNLVNPNEWEKINP